MYSKIIHLTIITTYMKLITFVEFLNYRSTLVEFYRVLQIATESYRALRCYGATPLRASCITECGVCATAGGCHWSRLLSNRD